MIPSHLCILVVEDDEILRYAVTRCLKHLGFCVIEAHDGPSAMQRETEYDGTIHALVTDINMPGFDGHVLGQKIKDKRPDIKIVIVSAAPERDFPPEAKSYDFAFLKPVTTEEIVSKLASLLNQ